MMCWRVTWGGRKGRGSGSSGERSGFLSEVCIVGWNDKKGRGGEEGKEGGEALKGFALNLV